MLVLALFNQYRQEKDKFVRKYIDFLSDGTISSPEELLKKFNLELTSHDIWKQGFKEVEKLINELEQLF
ncbi:MAG: hypothetical protein ACFFD1_01525 [Candidatus Thorarchaeota archaeon]